MLVYVAQLVLDWLARGPWREPGTATTSPTAARSIGGQVLPVIFGDRSG